MSRKLSLAACSHYVFTSFPYENLGEKGFNVDSEWKNEKNGIITQTLFIPSPNPLNNGPVALDFLEIIDEEEFMKSIRNQNQTSGQKGRDILRPCVRFWGDVEESQGDNLFQTVGSIPVQIESIKKKEEYFKKIGIENKNLIHPNSAKYIWGLYLGLSNAEKEDWSHFLDCNLNDKSQWILDDGSIIQSAIPGDGIYEYMEARKDFPFWAVVIQSESFSEVEKHFEFDKTFQWGNKKALLIKEHLTDWDIIVI